MEGTGSTLLSGRLFWRQLRFGGNWLHNILQKIVLKAGKIWRELAPHHFWQIVFENWKELVPHYFLEDCFRGSSDLTGTGSTLFSSGWFRRQLKFDGNWLHIVFRQIVLEAAHIIFRQIVFEAAQIWRELAPHYFPADFFEIWRELAPHYFPADCFGGSSDLAGTGSTFFSDRLFLRPLKFSGNWLHIIFQ